MKRIWFKGNPFPDIRLIFALVFYILGIAAGDICVTGAVWVLVFCTVICGLCCRSRYILLFALCFLAGAFLYTAGRTMSGTVNNIAEPIESVEGTVISVPEYSDCEKQLMLVKECRLNSGNYACGGKILLYSSNPLPYGARIRVNSVPEPINGTSAIGIDYGKYMARQNIYLSVSADSENTEYLGISDNLFVRWTYLFRNLLIHKADNVMPPEPAGLALGMLLGSSDYSSDDLWLDSVKTGIVHLLAASGFHCILIGLLIRILFGWVPDYRLRCAFVICILWLYVTLIGFAPGAVRGAVCMSLFEGAIIFRRGLTKPSYYLFLACFAILLVSPCQLFDAGFQLSFLCAASLFLVAPYMLMPIRSFACRTGINSVYVLAPFIASLCVTAAVFPFLSLYFGYYSFWGIIFNVILSGLVSLFFFFGLAAIAFSGIWGIGYIASITAGLVGDITVAAIHGAAGISPLSVTGAFGGDCMLLWYLAVSGLCLLLWKHYGKKRRKTIV